MKFEVREATSSDLDDAKSIYGPDTGDLSSAAVGVTWPLERPDDLETAKARAGWSCQQQKELLENDSTTRFIKVVDVDKNDELVAVGRWHRYPHGSQHVADLEAVGLKDRSDPATFPEGFNKDVYLHLLDTIFLSR